MTEKMMDRTCTDFAAVLAAKESVPGGGGAAAYVGALGVALCSMVGTFTTGKKRYAAVEGAYAGIRDDDQHEPHRRVANGVGQQPFPRHVGKFSRTARRRHHDPCRDQKREPQQTDRHRLLRTEGRQEQRRDRQYGQVRRRSVVGEKLLHFLSR